LTCSTVHPKKLTGECDLNYMDMPLDLVNRVVSTTFPR